MTGYRGNIRVGKIRLDPEPNANSKGKSLSIVLPEKTRVQIEERQGEIKVTVPTKRNWFVFIFLTAWLGGWAMGEVTVSGILLGGVASTLVHHSHSNSGGIPVSLFMVFWLCGWTIGGVFAIAVWLYQLKGKETISRDERFLKHTRDFVIYKKKREYLNEHVKDLRMSSPSGSIFFNMSPERAMEFWGISGGTISFDYGAKTIRMGTGLDEADAKPLVETLSKFGSSG